MSHHVVTANLTRTMTETILEEIVPLEELRIDVNSKVYLYSPVNEIVSAQLIDALEYCMGLTRGDIPKLPLSPENTLILPEDMIELLYGSKWTFFPELPTLQAIQKGFGKNYDLPLLNRRHYQEFMPSRPQHTYTLFFRSNIQIRRLNGELCVSGVTKVQTSLNPCFAVQDALRYFVKARGDDEILKSPEEVWANILSISRILNLPIPIAFVGLEPYPRPAPSCYLEGKKKYKGIVSRRNDEEAH